MLEVGLTDGCPNCEHILSAHTVDLGCMTGWTYGPEGGPSLTDGCLCRLTLCQDVQ